jgi:arsenate reductase (glutaredoxin)
MKIYHNPRCSKSRQCLAIILDNGADVEITEYLKDPLSFSELKETINILGVPALDIVRKGEADYKENFKGKDLAEDDWIQAMIDYPKLMERPIVINGNQAIVARPPEDVIKLLK